MSKTATAKAKATNIKLAEWCEDNARLSMALWADADTVRERRRIAFRGAQFARCATALRAAVPTPAAQSEGGK